MREPGDAASTASLPGEVRLAGAQAPTPAVSPTVPSNLPTPGVSPAVARVPGAPTLPDPADASGLTALISRLANEFYRAPPNAAGSAPAVPAEGQGVAAAPTTTAVPPTSPSPTNSVPGAAPTTTAPSMPTSGASTVATSPMSLSVPSPLAGAIPTAPSTAPAVPSAPSVPTSATSTSVPTATPFNVAPNFDALFATPPLSFPLLDVPVEQATAQPATPSAPLPHFEVAPTADPSVRDLGPSSFDPASLRREFPMLEERVNGKRLVWLDNAATTQKPRAVIDRLTRYYERENSNVHRAAHTLAARASDAYEAARETVRRFLNAPSARDIVFVRGATEGINLVAQSWGKRNVGEGDEIVITWLEHHANIVPWQQLCAATGARLRVAPVDDRGQILLDEYEKLLGPKTRLVSLTQVSNALGTVTPAAEMVHLAHRHGAKVLVDGAQAVSHMRVDVQALDCDFYVFSGHKVFAPTGIGAVFGKGQLLEATPPWQGGGNMIQDVTFERSTFQGPPARFEAGTGNIADAVGLGAALDWLSRVGLEVVGRHEHELLEYATDCLLQVPGLTVIGTAPDKAGVLSFTLAGQKTEAVGGLLDKEGIAVRSGHHCAQPILRRFGVEATVRASFAPYNTRDDVDVLAAALHRLQAGR